MGKYIFQNHPFKDEILKMFDDGKNPYNVEDFLKEKGDEYLISRPTLYKHYNRYKKANKELESPEKAKQEEFKNKLEKELWETIDFCAEQQKDKTLSPKDWQYFDQQKQAAIEKLMRMKDIKGSTEDASQILSKFFQKFNINKAAKEDDTKGAGYKEEPEVTKTDDETTTDNNEPGGSGVVLPGEPV